MVSQQVGGDAEQPWTGVVPLGVSAHNRGQSIDEDVDSLDVILPCDTDEPWLADQRGWVANPGLV